MNAVALSGPDPHARGEAVPLRRRLAAALVAAILVAPLGVGVAARPALAVDPAPKHPIAYVANQSGGSVTMIDTTTNTVVGTIGSVGSGPWAIAITPDGHTAYVANYYGSDVTPIDLTTSPPTVRTHIALPAIGTGNNAGPQGIAVSPDGHTLWVANAGTGSEDPPAPGTVVPIDITTTPATVGTAITVGRVPDGIAVTPDGSTVYVVNWYDDTATKISTSSKTVLKTFSAGLGPSAIAISPDGSTAWVTRWNGGGGLCRFTVGTEASLGCGATGGRYAMATAVAVTADGSFAYATAWDDYGTNAEYKFDASTGARLDTELVGRQPSAVAITPDGTTVYVANHLDGTVTPIDTTTTPWETPGTPIAVGSAPNAIAISPDQAPVAHLLASPAREAVPTMLDASASTVEFGTIASYQWHFGDTSPDVTTTTPTIMHSYLDVGTYQATVTLTSSAGTSTTKAFTGQTMGRNGGPGAVGRLAVSVTASPAPTVTSVTPGSGTRLGGTPVTISGTGLWGAAAVQFGPRDAASFTVDSDTQISAVAPAGIGTVDVRVVTAGGATPTVAADRFAYSLAPIAYVANMYSGSVTPIDTGTMLAGPSVAVGAQPQAIAITPDGRTAYTANWAGNSVTAIDTVTNTVKATIGVGTAPRAIAITPDGGTAYVANTGSNTVTPIDTTTNTAGTAIAVGSAPYGIAITPDGHTAYVSNSGDGTVSVIDVATGTRGASIAVGPSPHRIAITPDGRTAWVVNDEWPYITPIDVATNAAGAHFGVAGMVEDIAIAPDGHTAYVADLSLPGAVVPVDLATRTVGTPIAFSSRISAVAVAPDGETVIAANYSLQGTTVTPIDAATRTKGATVAVGAMPTAIAVTPDQAPTAHLSVTPGVAGQTTSFDASGSTAAFAGTLAAYRWDFGDGSPVVSTTAATMTHVYAAAGSYIASVSAVSAEGTSAERVFTGQTMLRNGLPQARAETALLISAASTTSDELVVDGNCSLREAIRAANMDVAVDACPAGHGADTIYLGAGTYPLAIAGAGEDLAATGDLDVTDDLTIVGAGASSTIIDGADLDRVFHVMAGKTVTLRALTVRNGTVSGNGGGILNGGTLTLDAVAVRANVTTGTNVLGGGIDNTGTLTVVDSTLADNTSGGWGNGGAIGNEAGATATVTGSTITGNTATGGLGGGIWNAGTVTLRLSTVSGNTSGSVGAGLAMENSAGSLTISDSTVSGNTASSSGGGIGIYYGPVTVERSTVSGNIARGDGGGIWVYEMDGNPLSITNSTLSGNAANLNSGFGGHGGGLATYQGSRTTFVDSTVTGNTSAASGSSGPGVFTNSGWPSAKGTIIAGNGTANADCSWQLTTLGKNLGSSSCFAAGNVLTTTPGLGALADNGGPTMTHALLTGSAATDAASACDLPTDQRGISRPQGSACDIGAFEVAGAGKAPTTTTIACSPSATPAGTPTTCSATVDSGTASAPTGTVTFTPPATGTFASPGTCTLVGLDADSARCSLAYTPTALGTGTHLVGASYGGDTTHAGSADVDGFAVHVSNVAPTITSIDDQTTPEGVPTGSLSFTVGSAGHAPESLDVSGTSSDVVLVPDANIAFAGTGAERTLVVTPVAGQAGTATITVTVSDGVDSTSTTFLLTVIGRPVVTAIDPASGPGGAGTTVTITGTNLTGATAVHFGAAAATGVTSVSDTQVTAVAPAGSGTVDVTVTAPGGTSLTTTADRFTYLAPAVTAVSPTSGPGGSGTTVTVTGTSFTGATGVAFGTASGTSLHVVSDTELTVRAPSGAGTVHVTVTTPAGTSPTTTADEYTYLGPAVTAVSPTSGPGGAGTAVTITGSSLTGASSVTFGTVAATGLHVVSDTQLTAAAPAGSGTVHVTVTTAAGTSATSAADEYTYLVPSVAGVSPASGSTTYGAQVTITGSAFTGATAVHFGTAAATSISVVSDTQIRAASGGGTGTVHVTVTTPAGTSATSAADELTYAVVPVALVANMISNTVSPIDLTTDAAGPAVSTGSGSYPAAVAFTPDGKTAYVAAKVYAGRLVPIDIATGHVGTGIAVGHYPAAIAITPDGQKLYVANSGDRTVSVVSTASNSVTATITVDWYPTSIAITPDGSAAYVLNSAGYTVSRIDVAGDTVTGSTPVGDGTPWAIAITPDGTTAYVSDQYYGTLLPIALATGTAGAPIPVTDTQVISALAITPDGSAAWVAGETVVVPVNLASGTAGSPIPVGQGPVAIAFTADGHTAYVVNQDSNTVSVIDAATRTVTKTIGVGSYPQAIALQPAARPTPTVSIGNVPSSGTYGGSFTPEYTYTGDGTTSVTSSTTGVCTVAAGVVSYVGVGTCTLVAHATATAHYGAATGADQSFTIAQATPTIAIADLPASGTFGGGFTPTFSYAGDGTTSVTSSTTGVCTVAAGVVSYVGVGTCTLVAHAAATANNAAATGADQSFTIAQATPTVAIDNLPAAAQYGGSFTPTFAYTGDGTTSVTSSTTGVCTVASGVVGYVGVGTCTLVAHATATTNHAAATGAEQSFAVGQATPTIAVSNVPSSATFGGSFTPTFAYTGDGTPSVSASPAGVCVVSAGGVVSYVGVGTCTLVAHATATTNDAAATGDAQPFTIGQATPTVSISNLPSSATFGRSFTPAFSYAGDGTTSVTSSTTDVCTVSSGVVSYVGVGTCTLVGHATATTNNAAATGAPQSFPVSTATQSITVTTHAPATAAYKATFDVAATASSGLDVVITATGSCGVALGGTRTATIEMTSGSGTCTVTYDQAGDAAYDPAPQLTDTVTATKVTQKITVTKAAPTTKVYKGSFTVTATASSGMPVAISVTGVCSVNPIGLGAAEITMTSGTGICTVLFDQAGDANWAAAPQVTAKVSATKAAQAITVQTEPPKTAAFKSSFTVAATASGGPDLPVRITTSGACTGTGYAAATVSMSAGTGTCTVLFNQAGDANYAAAPQVTRTVTAQKAMQTITFEQPASPQTFGATFHVAPTSDSSLTVAVAAGTGSVCTVAAATGGGWDVTMTSGTGSCVLTASQAGNANWLAAVSVSRTVDAQKASATITIRNLPASGTFGGGFTPTFSYAGDGTTSVTSSTTGVCTVAAGVVSYVGVGTCTLVAHAAATANYEAATGAGQSVDVGQASQAISFTSTKPTGAVYGGTYVVTATGGGSGNPVVLAIATASSDVCSLSGTASGSTVTFVGVGTCTIEANQAGNANYAAAPQVTQAFAIGKAPLTVTADNLAVQYSDPLPTLTAHYAGFVLDETPAVLDGTLSCTTTATVTGGKVVSPAGPYKITCSGLTSDDYAIAYVAGTLTVGREDTVIRLAQSNPHAVPVAVSGTDKGKAPAMTFVARITEAGSAPFGDISKAIPVTLTLTPIGGGSAITCTMGVVQTQLATATSPGFEVVSCKVPAGTAINVYEVDVSIGGTWYQGADASVLTVYDPTLGGTNGAGTIVNPNTTNTADIAFSAAYLKNSRQVQGKFLYVSRDASGAVVHVLKGNVMSTLAITGTTAKVTGKATLDGVGNYAYVVTGVDNGTLNNPNPAATPDRYGQKLTDAAGATVTNLTFDPVVVTNGNVFVGLK